jgi:cell division protein FtsW
VKTFITEHINKLGHVDKYVLWSVLILCAAGVVAVYSAISFFAETRAGGDTEQYLLRHSVRVVLALGVMGAVSMIDYRRLARYSRYFLIAALGLLLVVQVAGATYGGATRWLRVGTFGFQPSDLVKVALLLYLAVLLAKKQAYIKDFGRAFVPLMVWIMASVVLIGMEDLSTAALLFSIALVMCFVGRVSLLHLSGLTLVCLGLAFALLLSSPTRAARVEAFVGANIFPHTDQEEVESLQYEGYQAHQARIAFAMGGLTGVGPGKSTQRDFLPHPYNDFIFAIIAEEYGALGALGLLSLFGLILCRGLLRIARRAPDPLGLFLAVGVTVMVTSHGFIHAGVASGLLPVTGLALPFVSYGGTSMVSMGALMGVLLNISLHTQSTTD